MAAMENISVSFNESNGDGIFQLNINDTTTMLIPNIGDEVFLNDEGKYRKVKNRTFQYLKNTKTIHVMITLEE